MGPTECWKGQAKNEPQPKDAKGRLIPANNPLKDGRGLPEERFWRVALKGVEPSGKTGNGRPDPEGLADWQPESNLLWGKLNLMTCFLTAITFQKRTGSCHTRTGMTGRAHASTDVIDATNLTLTHRRRCSGTSESATMRISSR